VVSDVYHLVCFDKLQACTPMRCLLDTMACTCKYSRFQGMASRRMYWTAPQCLLVECKHRDPPRCRSLFTLIRRQKARNHRAPDQGWVAGAQHTEIAAHASAQGISGSASACGYCHARCARPPLPSRPNLGRLSLPGSHTHVEGVLGPWCRVDLLAGAGSPEETGLQPLQGWSRNREQPRSRGDLLLW
jgi:hypothetical protein